MKTSRQLLVVVLVAGLAGLALWLLKPRSTIVPSRAPVAIKPTERSGETQTAVKPAPLAPQQTKSVAVPAQAVTAPIAMLPASLPPATPTQLNTSAPVETPSAAVPGPTGVPSELAAAARMYAAHAPLRAAEVADPDSQPNKQILGAMVAKMLSRQVEPPPPAAAGN